MSIEISGHEPSEEELRLLAARLASHEIVDPSEIRNAIYDLGGGRYLGAKETIQGFLRFPDAEVREAAVTALAFDFRSYEHVPILEEMIQGESDEDVLRAAVAGFGSLLMKSRDLHAAQQLAGVLREGSHDIWTRQSAYAGILSISGVEPRDHPFLGDTEGEFIDSVDWALISRIEAGQDGWWIASSKQ